jgi:predicted dehydrogenase
MQNCEWSELASIASRNRAKAENAAREFGIPKACGSYEELLADPDIEAVYIPLPNELHEEWSIKAAVAGKHVLCEKPLTTTVASARRIIEARDRAGVKMGEAFMVRVHPRWLRTRELVREGRIGRLRCVHTHLGYFNRDPDNIRNKSAGGGALLDIGCYAITFARFIFGEEPSRVIGLIENDPELKTDRLTSGILEFPSGQSTFTCSTQLYYHTQVQVLGTNGRIEIDVPLNPPTDAPSLILIDDGNDPHGAGIPSETIPVCNQFTIQADAFSRAIREDGEVAVPLEDSIANIAAMEGIFRSAKSGKWESPSEIS